MKESIYIREKIRWFKFEKILYYWGRIGIYKKRHMFFRKNRILQNEGLEYGVLNVEEMTFIYNINDITLPLEMYEQNKVFASDDITLFFELIQQKYDRSIIAQRLFFLDIGANIGTTTVYVNKYYKKSIISFEPSEDNYKLLEVNCRMNECLGVKLEKLGISNSSKKVMMEINETNHGNNQIVRNVIKDKKYEKINTTTIDEYLKSNNIPYGQIGYIWIDIEGHEPYALTGMKELLFDHKIPIFMEFWNTRISSDEFNMMYDVLNKVYEGFCVIDNGRIVLVEDIGKLRKLYEGNSIKCDLFFW